MTVDESLSFTCTLLIGSRKLQSRSRTYFNSTSLMTTIWRCGRMRSNCTYDLRLPRACRQIDRLSGVHCKIALEEKLPCGRETYAAHKKMSCQWCTHCLMCAPAGLSRLIQADAKRRADHEKKVAEHRAAAADRRHKKEMEKHDREKQEDEQRCRVNQCTCQSNTGEDDT